MMRNVPRAFLGLALLLTARPIPLLAANVNDTLRQGLKEVDQKLRDKDWGAAEKQAQKLARALGDEAGTGPEAAHSLAVVTAFRAIAEAGLGQTEDAAWHWDMALNLDPEIAKADVSPYGAPAAGLRTRQLRSAQPPDLGEGMRVVDGNGAPQPGIERPKPIKTPKPEYPSQLRDRRLQGLAIVETVIGTDGRPREPRVLSLKGGGPSMAYAALEALRQWRFEPARLDGKPKEVYYILSIAFHVGR